MEKRKVEFVSNALFEKQKPNLGCFQATNYKYHCFTNETTGLYLSTSVQKNIVRFLVLTDLKVLLKDE